MVKVAQGSLVLQTWRSDTSLLRERGAIRWVPVGDYVGAPFCSLVFQTLRAEQVSCLIFFPLQHPGLPQVPKAASRECEPNCYSLLSSALAEGSCYHYRNWPLLSEIFVRGNLSVEEMAQWEGALPVRDEGLSLDL